MSSWSYRQQLSKKIQHQAYILLVLMAWGVGPPWSGPAPAPHRSLEAWRTAGAGWRTDWQQWWRGPQFPQGGRREHGCDQKLGKLVNTYWVAHSATQYVGLCLSVSVTQFQINDQQFYLAKCFPNGFQRVPDGSISFQDCLESSMSFLKLPWTQWTIAKTLRTKLTSNWSLLFSCQNQGDYSPTDLCGDQSCDTSLAPAAVLLVLSHWRRGSAKFWVAAVFH